MCKSEEDIAARVKRAKDNQQLVLLYGIVNSSTKKIKAKKEDKTLKENIQSFKDNMDLLIKLVFENGIASENLSRYLIVIIHEVLSNKEEADFKDITISDIKNNLGQIINSMVILYKLCQNEVFKTALCNIQSLFSTNCILNTESPAYNLRRQLQLWQFHLAEGESNSQYAAAKQAIPVIESHIKTIEQYTEDAKEFCKQNAVSP